MASSEIVKRQHFVPRTYLKHFSVQKGEDFFINVLPRLEKEEDKIFESNIKNVCLQKHLYTLPGETDEEKMLLEKFYSDNYESQYDRIYEILTNPAKTIITKEDRELIISTVITMFYRTSRWITLHNDLIKRVYTILFQVCEQTGKDFFEFEGQKISIAGKKLDELIKEHTDENRPIQVLTQLEVAMKLINVRQIRDGILVFKLCDEVEFITSDNPVIANNPYQKDTMPFDPNNILKLPLDSKHILYLMPYSEKETQNIIIRKNLNGVMCNMERLVGNYELIKLSERFIFGSNEGLKSYLKTKELSESPMNSDEHKKLKTIQDFIEKGKELGII
jgi:hypothetical protein